jgi:hypothetical protein
VRIWTNAPTAHQLATKEGQGDQGQDVSPFQPRQRTLPRLARSAITAKKAAPSELTVSEPPQFVKTSLKTKSHQTTARDVASRSAQALQSHAGGGPRTSAAFNPPSPKEFDIV